MGKSLPSSARFHDLTRVIAADKFTRPNRRPQVSQVRVSPPPPTPLTKTDSNNRIRVDPLRMESLESGQQSRVPLGRVVSDCARRWFQDTLKEARGGDTAMQVLVGQMYHSGYGVPKNPQKANAWISRASKGRNSVWKVSEKQPGYHASDSDSVDLEDDAK